MIDALLFAVRDGIIAANIGYGAAECDIMTDGRPPPRAGNYFASVHDGESRNDAVNTLMEFFGFKVTLTMRIVVPFDKAGNQQMARNVALTLARKQGFNAKLEQLRALINMNWRIAVLSNQTPPSANDNIAAWTPSGTVYGFTIPQRLQGSEFPKLVYDDWFQTGDSNQATTPDANIPQGIKAQLTFGKAQRMQPVTSASGPFV